MYKLMRPRLAVVCGAIGMCGIGLGFLATGLMAAPVISVKTPMPWTWTLVDVAFVDGAASGSFDFDANNLMLSNVDITVTTTGPTLLFNKPVFGFLDLQRFTTSCGAVAGCPLLQLSERPTDLGGSDSAALLTSVDFLQCGEFICPQPCRYCGHLESLENANLIPEPATLALLGVGLAGLGFPRRKQ